MFEQKRLIAEFEEQSFTQIIFPHSDTDWQPYLQEAQKSFCNIINTIIKFQKCLVICDNIQEVKKHFQAHENLFFTEYKTDDTWARDCSALSIEENKEIKLLDFTFNGWGGKFEAKRDNRLSSAIQNCYSAPIESKSFILEGGAVESNGRGTILTTAHAMLNPNRNLQLTKTETTKYLKEFFGAKDIYYLNHGSLIGDDTDSHIDTLVRFATPDTLMYVKCSDKTDAHYHQLQLMERELQILAKEKNFQLIALPMPDAIYYEEERLPATYANFLFVNGALLVPIYNVKQDQEALKIFKSLFQEREIIPVDASLLIRQHGSLHCVTMNFAAGIDLCC